MQTINRIPVELKTETTSADTTTIYIYGHIGADIFGDGITANGVREILDSVTTNNIFLRINSGGGDMFQSLAIRELLLDHPAKIHVKVDALAGSGASAILTAGDYIEIPDTALVMIHKPWACACGNVDELLEIAAEMEKFTSVFMNSYKNRFRGTDAEFEELFNGDTWLTADECYKYGFCDKVIRNETKNDTQAAAAAAAALAAAASTDEANAPKDAAKDIKTEHLENINETNTDETHTKNIAAGRLPLLMGIAAAIGNKTYSH